MSELGKLLMCMIIPGGFCLVLALLDLAMNILCDSSDRVQKWVGSWTPEDDDDWEDEE